MPVLRFLLRNPETRRFYKAPGEWVASSDDACDFGSVFAALHFSVAQETERCTLFLSRNETSEETGLTAPFPHARKNMGEPIAEKNDNPDRRVTKPRLVRTQRGKLLAVGFRTRNLAA